MWNLFLKTKKMESKKILYKFPCRERKEKFFAAVENIISLSRHDNFEILATFDINDPTFIGTEIKDKIASYNGKLKAIWGTSTGKIHACSRDMEFAGPFDILCLHSDDMVFLKEGFDLDILEAFENFNGLVHFPDGHANERLITYAMMSKEYFDLFGYIYNPEYESVYADNEQFLVAKYMNRYKFVNKSILEHRHHAWGFGPADDLLKRTEDKVVYERDRQTFERRKQINFGL